MSNLSKKSTAAKVPNMPIDSFVFLVLYNANRQHIKYVLDLKKSRHTIKIYPIYVMGQRLPMKHYRVCPTADQWRPYAE